MKSQKTVSFLGLEDDGAFCYDTGTLSDFQGATMFITEDELPPLWDTQAAVTVAAAAENGVGVAVGGCPEAEAAGGGEHERSGSMVVNDDVEQDSKIHDVRLSQDILPTMEVMGIDPADVVESDEEERLRLTLSGTRHSSVQSRQSSDFGGFDLEELSPIPGFEEADTPGFAERAPLQKDTPFQGASKSRREQSLRLNHLSLGQRTAFNEEEEDVDAVPAADGDAERMLSLRGRGGLGGGQRPGSHFPVDSLMTLSFDVKEQMSSAAEQAQSRGMRVIAEHEDMSPDKVAVPRRNTMDRMIAEQAVHGQGAGGGALPIWEQSTHILSPGASPLPIMRNSSRFEGRGRG